MAELDGQPAALHRAAPAEAAWPGCRLVGGAARGRPGGAAAVKIAELDG